MLTPEFALKIFEGFSIERWNDLVRPFDIIEMDKTAEKMILVYIIGKFEEAEGKQIDWDWAIYSSLFDLLKKIALCDIKSPVQRMIRAEFPEEYKKLNDWVLLQYREVIGDDALFALFADYLTENEDANMVRQHTARIVRAAHKYSALRELEMISMVNEPERLGKIRKGLSLDIVDYLDLRALQQLITKQRSFDLLLIIEQLRFQIRWNQTPRVPKTSVLGHSYFVAALTLLMGRDASPCPRRRFNNFFSALFHDLPEAVTRDIISPVKRATGAISDIIKQIEDEIVTNELYPLMEDFYRDEIAYFTNNEFDNRVLDGGVIRVVPFPELNGHYNADSYSPVDGALIRCADHIAAFIEADQSIKHGITSAHLKDGRDNLLSQYSGVHNINNFDIALFLASF
ncbi:MAG: HD domain-containing protein [Treponemataceae bacterium]|nr:MAG: HD domain-containing protein [Treponemataceae bacterium]